MLPKLTFASSEINANKGNAFKRKVNSQNNEFKLFLKSEAVYVKEICLLNKA